MKRKVVFATFALLLATSYLIADDALAGAWVNTDANTGGLTRIEIRQVNNGWTIQAWGAAGQGKENDIGSVALHVLADTGASKLKYGIAFWDSGFKHMYLTLRWEKGELVVESFNVFRDNSGRPNYRKAEKFKRNKVSFDEKERVRGEPSPIRLFAAIDPGVRRSRLFD